MSVRVTESAARQIRDVAGRMGGIGVRLGIKQVGCSGLTYTYDVAKEVREGDLVVQDHDATLVVDKDAVPIVEGSELDYIREGFKQLFTVKNPNVKSTCGCGESFNV
jgi:iron-sulfur cluster assembly protein